MQIAKSMVLGGAIISAEDTSYKSYIDLKLRCFYCGEPVFLKDGHYRVKHFSHFPNINSHTLEECILRQKNNPYHNGNSSSIAYLSKNQRLKLFQDSYLRIILCHFERNNLYEDALEIMKQKINMIKNESFYFFLEYYEENIINLFVQTRYSHNSDTYLSNLTSEENQLNREIARESISYLKVKSSRKILSHLIHYIFYELNANQKDHRFLANLNHDDTGKIHQIIKMFPDIIVQVLSSVDYINSIKESMDYL